MSSEAENIEAESVEVGVQTEALQLASCDTPSQPRWGLYGQNLLGHRCVKGGDLPTAATAPNLDVAWENTVTAGTTSTPIVSHGNVFYGDAATNFYNVDEDTGAVIWQVNLFTPGTVSGFDPIRSSAAATNTHVYVATGHKLFKLNRADGSIVWSHLMDPHWAVLIDSSPILFDDMVLIGVAGFELVINVPQRTFRGSVVAIDQATGEERWRTYTTNDDAGSGAGVSVWSSFSVDEQRRMAFIGTGQTYEPPASPLSDSLLAVDVDTGDVLWSHQLVANDIFVSVPVPGPGPDSDVGATPNLFTLDGQDVVGVGNKSGLYKIFNRDTGAEIKSIQLITAVQVAQGDPNIPDEYGTAYVGGIMGSAAVANGIIYVNSNIWFYYDFVNFGVHNPADTSITYAIDARTGAVLWARPLPAPHFGGLTKVNDAIFHTLITGQVIGLNAANGSIVFDDQLPANSAGGGISVQGDKLYVGYGFLFTGSPVPVTGVRAYSLN